MTRSTACAMRTGPCGTPPPARDAVRAGSPGRTFDPRVSSSSMSEPACCRGGDRRPRGDMVVVWWDFGRTVGRPSLEPQSKKLLVPVAVSCAIIRSPAATSRRGVAWRARAVSAVNAAWHPLHCPRSRAERRAHAPKPAQTKHRGMAVRQHGFASGLMLITGIIYTATCTIIKTATPTILRARFSFVLGAFFYWLHITCVLAE